MFTLIGTIVGNFRHADWRGSAISEAFRATIGTNCWPFFIDRTGKWNKRKIKNLLDGHGIVTWGWGHWRNQLYFRVKRRQAEWAQYILLENGVPVQGRLLREGVSTSDDIAENAPQTMESRRAPHKDAGNLNPIAGTDRLIDKLSQLDF